MAGFKILFEKVNCWKNPICQFFVHNVLITRPHVFGPRLWFWALVIPHQSEFAILKSDCNFWRYGLKKKNTFCSTQPEPRVGSRNKSVRARRRIMGYLHVTFRNCNPASLWERSRQSCCCKKNNNNNNKKDSPDFRKTIKDFENRNLLTRTVNLHKVQILKDFSRNTSQDAASIKINSFEIWAKLFEIWAIENYSLLRNIYSVSIQCYNNVLVIKNVALNMFNL